MDLKQLVLEILEKGYLMSLATNDEAGPWVADVIYVFDDDLNIYWVSKIDTRHSKSITVNNKVAASVTVSNNQGEINLGIQLEGTAVKIDGQLKEMAIKHLAKRNKSNQDTKNVLSEGRSWYKLAPSRIEIINEELWGYTKQVLQLS